jgi:hypothetical protein
VQRCHRIGRDWAVWWGISIGLAFVVTARVAAAFSLATGSMPLQPETQSYATGG